MVWLFRADSAKICTALRSAALSDVSAARALTAELRGTGLICSFANCVCTSLDVDHLTHSHAASWFLDAAATAKPQENVVDTWSGLPGERATANLSTTLDCLGSLASEYR